MNQLESISSFTDDQLLRLVNNTITTRTDFDIGKFTGGSVQITSTNNHTITNYKVSLFFGYQNKKPLARTITIDKETFFIWSKALMLKTLSLKNENLGMNYNELNILMNSNLDDNSNKVIEKKSIVRVDLPVEILNEIPEYIKNYNENQVKKDLAKDKRERREEELFIQSSAEIKI